MNIWQIIVAVLSLLSVAFLTGMVTEARTTRQKIIASLLFALGLLTILFLLHWTGVFRS